MQTNVKRNGATVPSLGSVATLRRWLCNAAVALAALTATSAALAEGSRTLMPAGYASGRASLNLRNPTVNYAGVAQERQFLYVYAEAGEYILVGTSNRATVGATTGNGDVLIYERPPGGFGARGNETRPATAAFSCASTTPPANSFSGAGRGIIGSRTAELAGPNSADGSVTVVGGYNPCAYRVPTTGIYGVQFTGAANGAATDSSTASLTTWELLQRFVLAWDVTVRASAASVSDLNARVFTYAWVTFNNTSITPTLYYATTDGYRYEQIMRGINPGAAVFFGNSAGFLDNGQPLYRDVRGTNQPANTGFPAGVSTQPPQSPIFFSSIAGNSANAAQAEQTLGALGIPLTPPTPQLTSPNFVGNIEDNRSTVGAGGVFTFNTVNTLTYEIVISRDGVDFDPANVNNRTLTGTALTGSHTVPWNGLDNSGVAFPASGTPYTYRVSGRNGEIHFPIIDIEGNGSGGPTLRKLNGSGGTTVYFDDRGYITRGGTAVGALNGHLCGAGSAIVQPTPNHSLIGVDSNAVTGGRYYRWWPGSSDPNTDCSNAANVYFGTAKALDLWALEKTVEFNQPIVIEPQSQTADVGTTVTMTSSALPGDTVFGSLTFGNFGVNTANNVTYGFVLGTPGSCPAGVSFTLVPAGVTTSYNAATCAVTFTGLPANLAGNATRTFNFQYTAPATGTVTATSTIAATQDPLPGTNSPNTSTATTIVQVADLAISKTASSPVLLGGPVTFTVRVWNNGPRPVSGAVVSDNVPASVTGVSWTCVAVGTATCGSTSGTGNAVGLTVNLPVDTGATTTADTNYVELLVTGTASSAGALDNTASVQVPTGTSDPTPGNNSATSSSTVSNAADLSLVKSDGGVPAAAGQTVTYTLAVTNGGPSTATGVSVTDTLPAGLTFIAASGTGWTCNQAAGVVTCTRPTLAVGAAPAITLQLGVPAAYAGANPISNTASVSSALPDPTPGNNSGSDTTPVQFAPTAVDDAATTPFGQSVPINVPGNDTPGTAPLDPASVSILTPPGNGTVIVNPTTGVVTYTPAASFSGTDSFTYQICDTSAPTPLCDSATVTVVVGPNAQDDIATTPQNTPLVSTVGGNDIAPPGSTYSVVTPPTSGSLVLGPNGGYTYTPVSGFSGPVTFTYQVCLPAPNQALCDTATVTITVGGNTLAANDDSDGTAQNTPVTTVVLQNDTVTGAPLDPASVTIVTPSPNGTATPNPDGTVTFVPAPNFSGVTTYGYQVCDTSLPTPVCDTATVTITVAPNTVDAVDDGDSTAQNTPVTTTVIGNDTVLPGGAPLDPGSVAIVTPSPDGTATPNPDGSITFVPDPGFSGTATYTYSVCDVSTPTPVCDTATVEIVVGANLVAAVDDSDSTAQNTPVTTIVLGNDTTTGAPLDPTSVTITVPSADGTATVNPDGSVTFEPAPNFSGTTTYSYEVCDLSTPTPVCDTAQVTITVAPNVVSALNDGDTTAQNTPVTTTVLGNDGTLPGGAPLDPGSVAIVAPSPDGTLVVNPDGTIEFTPNTNFSGTTTYTYEVCDVSVPTPVCDEAIVTITVDPNTIAAQDDTDSTPQNTPVTTTVLGNDSSTGAPLDPASVSIVAQSADGNAVANPDGTVTFTPDPGFSGVTTYSYEVCDLSTPVPVCATALVTVTVEPNTVVADPDTDSTPQNTPVTTTVLDNDSVDPTGAPLDPGSVRIVTPSPDGTAVPNPDGTVTFTPNPNFSGVANYTYEVCDTSVPDPVCAQATVQVTVQPNVVSALNDADTTAQNTPVTTTVLGNDTVLPNGAPLDPGSVAIVTPSPDGTLVVNPDGTIEFTPNANFSGTTTYTYEVCDVSVPTPVCDEAVVTITVGDNTLDLQDDTDTTPQNTPVTTTVLANDGSTGAPLDPASVTIVAASPDGTAVPNADGTVTFTPDPNFSGTTSYSYQVCDLSTPVPVCGTALVTITVEPNVVTAVDDGAVTEQNTPVTSTVLGNDTVLPNGAPLDPGSVAVTVPSPDGSAVANPDGTITFTPNPGFSGTTTYTYQVCDLSVPTPVCDSAVVTVSIGDNLVAANDDSDTTPQNTPVTTPVLGNDTTTGAPLDPASVVVTTPSPNGSTVVNPDGSITFTPDDGFSGSTTYSYQVCDTSVPTPVCDTAVVTITVGDNLVVAVDDADSTPQNTPVTTVVLGNDSTTGAPLDPSSVTVTVPSPDGSTVVNPDGSITFTPNDGFSGTTTYSYEVCDLSTPTPVCDTAVVTITVAPNDIDALNDADNTPQNTPVTTSVLANDTVTGAPLDPASVVVTTPSPDGTTVVNPDGTITFTPAPNFSGVTTYSYQVCDTSTPTPLCDIAVVTITVGASTVVANNDFDTSTQNTPVTTPVLGNDSSTGAALDPGSVTVVTPSPDGSAVPNPDGSITFTPNPGFSGTTTYVYQVCDLSTPTPVCDTALVTITIPPNAVSALNDNDETPQNTPVTVPVLGNDSSTDLPLDPGSVVVTVPSPDGSTVVNPDGSIVFTPNPGFSGVTTFSYQVCDTSAPVPVCDEAVVTITVGTSIVTAVDDSGTTPQNTPVTLIVLGNDTSTGSALDPGSVAIVAQSADGTAVVNPDGSITFTPNPGFAGTTTYSYVVCDLSTPTPQCDTALVTIVVGSSTVVANDDTGTTPQDTPVTVPVIGNDTGSGPPLDTGSVTIVVPSPDGNLVVNPDGSITFTPNDGFSGETTYTYEVCDTTTPVPSCDTAVVTIVVGQGAIAAVADADTTPQGTPVTTDVLGNDSASQPLDPSSVTVTVASPDGSTVVNPDGSITFTPDADFFGVTTYTYRVCDTSTPTPVCDTAVVTITVPQGATSADLAVLKTGPANADAGEQIVFSIVVTNLGPDAADNVVLIDPTPAGLVFVGNGGDCTTAFPCALGDLAVGETRTVLATFLVPDDYTGPSTIVNIASVSSDTPDPTPGDTSSSASTLVQGGGTPGPTPVPQPLNIPVDGRWAMLLLGLATLLVAGLRLRRIG